MSDETAACPFCEHVAELGGEREHITLEIGDGPMVRSIVCCAMCYGVFVVEDGVVRVANDEEQIPVRQSIALIMQTVLGSRT